MEVLHCQGIDDPLYQCVQEIRHDGGEQVYFDFDQYSHHYVLHYAEKPLGTVTVHEASDGALDCESFYPMELLERHRDVLIGTCKMRIRRGAETPIQALRSLIQSAWADQLRRGNRITIVNAEERLTAFYRRIGFSYLPGFDFIHPQLGTFSKVLVMASDPTHTGYCQPLFESVPDPFSQQAVIDLCQRSNRVAVALADVA